jgi:hypothetical protein
MAIDFEQEFEKFIIDSSGSAIKDIYSIIPSLSQEQIQIYLTLQYYIEKYDAKPLKKFLDDYAMSMKKNKNLGFLSSMNMKSLLKAYTVDEQLRGIKINTNTNKEG